jgi:hypothetical protein
VSDVSYGQAVEIIKSSIDSSENLSEKDRGNIAESLLEIKNPQSSKQLEEVSLSFGPEQRDRLEAYLNQLEDVTQSNIDQEIQEAIERARRLSDLRNELKTRIHSAMDEARELEQIANKLQDDNLGNIAGKEEREIKQLGEKLQHIDSKAEEVEGLKQKISSLLDQLGEKSLKEHLEIKESAISQILQESSTNGGGKGNNETQIDIDQLAKQIIRDREKLEKFEQKARNDLQRDIEKLSELTEHKKNEINVLAGIHSDLQEGKLSEAKSKLDDIEEDRRNILDGEPIEDVFDDIQEIKKISVAVKKFFEEIEEIDQQGKIQELETALASNNGISENKAEELLNLKDQRQKYEKLKEEISNVEELEKENLGLDQKEYQRVKKLFNQESDLADRINDPDYQQIFNRIHSELEQLGHEIEHDIEIEGGSTSSGSETGRKDSDTGSYAKEGPDPDEPWIVSISDIHGNIQEATNVFGGLEKAGFKPVVDSSWNWKGNNYILVFNGDSFDGRDGRKENSPEVFKKIKNLRKSQGERIVHTYGNHDMFIPTAEYQKLIFERNIDRNGNRRKYNDPFFNYCIENPDVRSWILKQMRDGDGMYKASYSRYSFTYTHTGITYADAESDLEDLASEILEILSDEQQLNQLFEDLRENSSPFSSFATSSADRPEHLSRDKSQQLSVSLNTNKDVQSFDNDLKRALITGFLQYKKYAKLWELTTKRWSDVVNINHNNPKMIGHNKKGSCTSGTSIWQKGTNPRKQGKIVNENTIRDGDNPCLMLEKPNGELLAIRKDGEVEIVINN